MSFQKFSLKCLKYLKFIFLKKTIFCIEHKSFTCYAKYHSNTNNGKVVRKNAVLKVLTTIFGNFASVSCRGCHALSPNMQIIILLSKIF